MVADGRLHEKEGLRARVRELAAKRGVCLAFIAIDSQAGPPPTPAPMPTPAHADPGPSGSGGGDGARAPPEQQPEQRREAGSGSGAAPAEGTPGGGSGGSGGGGGAGGGGSLLDMQTVSFVGGRPVFRRYMDDFPFPYYVLLRDIGSLPRTLADLLRQWFELSAAS